MNTLKNKLNIENIIHAIFFILGITTIGCVLIISIYLIISGIPAIIDIGPIDFILGSKWKPTSSTASYGILPFILTSIYGTSGAIIIGVPIGILTALYLSKVASKKIYNISYSLISILAGIPSVVYGLIGMTILVPFVQKIFNLSDGSNLFSAIIILSIMILPSVINVSMDALNAVPKEYEYASLALGATPTETYMKVTLPAAKNGIVTAVILGIGRAIGEAMAVIMVAGNVSNMPSLFESVRFLTTAISSEMSYADGLHRQALFSIALVLFLFIMIINLILNIFIKKR